MSDLLNAAALDQLFRTARTQNAFLDTPVSEDLLRELYDLVKWGPTAANGSPARFVFDHRRGQGKAQAGIVRRQRRQDPGRTGDDDHWV